jgi:hypothetical protein
MSLKTNVAIFILLISCSSVVKKEDKPTDPIKAVRISQNFPLIDEKGKLLGYDTSVVNIYYYKNQVLCKDFYFWNSTTVEYEYDTITYRKGISESFFVYTSGNKYGLFFDKRSIVSDKKVLADSMLKEQWYNRIGLSSISLQKLAEEYNADSGTLHRNYTFKGKNDTLLKGTLSLWYTNKLNWAKYRLLKEVDTVSKMKLYRCKILNESRYFKDKNLKLDQIEQVYDFKEITVSNPEEIMYYFNRERMFKQDK